VIFVHGHHEQTPCPFFLTPHFAIAFKGLFSRDSFVYVPYNKPDKLVSDIQAYNVHIAFPLNGALAKLRGLKSAAFKKVRSRRLSGIFLLSFSLPCIAICVHVRAPAQPTCSHTPTPIHPKHIQITSVSTAVLWRPSKCFESSALIVEAFAPVAGLFSVVFIGCLLAGAVVVVIELQRHSSLFFAAEPGSKRAEELRGCEPFGHGFWFALISTR
jgi:hypothetical protein